MKPLIRGYVHKIAFFFAVIACVLLIVKSQGFEALRANILYSISLCGMYFISTIYHSRHWSHIHYKVMKSLDHSAIFILIAGTATPICLLGLKGEVRIQLLSLMWVIALVGIFMVTFWTKGPKWVRVFLYLALGWLAIPYFDQISDQLGLVNMELLIFGGILYTIGALIYALKRPNPYPHVLGYHEVFHIFVVLASACHYFVIYSITV